MPMTATTDAEALLAGILERPEDDVARLVYADWLEENGGTVSCPVCPPDEGEEPHPADIICDRCHGSRTVSDGQRERAEFIRDCIWMNANHTDCPVRLGDVKRGRPVPLRCGACEYCTARRRAEKFYAKHIWLPGVNYAVCFEPSPLDGPMPTGPGLTLSVSRGFVSTVRTTLADWLRHGPRIVAEQPVERVDAIGKEPLGNHGVDGYFGGDPDSPADAWFWIRDPYPVINQTEWQVPNEIYDLMPTGEYESPELALAALSLALVNWARREAGLPPLREHATA